MSEGQAPRPALMHWLVDSGIAFLAIVFVGWIVGLHLLTMGVIAAVLGAIATPFTRSTEARMLEERARNDVDGSDDKPDDYPSNRPDNRPDTGLDTGPDTGPDNRPFG